MSTKPREQPDVSPCIYLSTLLSRMTLIPAFCTFQTCCCRRRQTPSTSTIIPTILRTSILLQRRRQRRLLRRRRRQRHLRRRVPRSPQITVHLPRFNSLRRSLGYPNQVRRDKQSLRRLTPRALQGRFYHLQFGYILLHMRKAKLGRCQKVVTIYFSSQNSGDGCGRVRSGRRRFLVGGVATQTR